MNLDSVLPFHHCPPLLRATIGGVPGEQPVVSSPILRRILIFPMLGFMRLLEKLRTFPLRPAQPRLLVLIRETSVFTGERVREYNDDDRSTTRTEMESSR